MRPLPPPRGCTHFQLRQLSRRLGGVLMPEYGREYAERHGTEFTMADLPRQCRDVLASP